MCKGRDAFPAFDANSLTKANILIDEERKVRIADFGLLSITESQAFGTSHTVLTDRGSVRWMAPELFGSQVCKTRSTDVYAFGMTILEVIAPLSRALLSFLTRTVQIYTRSPPFAGLRNDMQIIMAVSQGRRPERPKNSIHLENELWTLVTQCWESDPKERPDIRRATHKVGDWLHQSVNSDPTVFNM
jgi:serine/threonine protein kinase